MDKIDCSHNKLVVFDTNVIKNYMINMTKYACLKLLKWLRLLVDMAWLF
jgi:hypothetical protein